MNDVSSGTLPQSATIAWISHGRLFVKEPGKPSRELDSEFAKQALQREMRTAQMDAWKGRSGVWGSLGMEPPGVAQTEQQNPRRQIYFRTIARAEKSTELFYVLDMGMVGGLFR